MDRKILPGFVEYIQTPADVAQAEQQKNLLKQIEDMKDQMAALRTDVEKLKTDKADK